MKLQFHWRVKKLLLKKLKRNRMKKFIYLLALFLIFTPAYAAELKGGVSYTVDSARNYLREEQVNNIEITGPMQFESGNTEKVVYSYSPEGEIIGITVQYINEPNKAYIYNKRGSLIYVDKYDRSVNIYPHRGYRYNLDGKLILTSLTVSKDEMFRFSPDGKLIAHSINGIIYDENSKVIGHGK